VLMHTRWHDDDLIGRLTEGEEREEWVDYFDFLKGARAKWVRLTLKAIAERDEAYNLQSVRRFRSAPTVATMADPTIPPIQINPLLFA
jgi:hypothetical protein